jgi:hypothetical protein
MKAKLVRNARIDIHGGFADVLIWEVPQPVCGSTHSYKYSLAYVVDDVCVLRYDNEAGKGDHKHINDREVSYTFTTLDQLVDDFRADIAEIGGKNG